jgi:recombination protein RecA
MKANEAKVWGLEKVVTGVTALDEILGGGVTLGCITEFFGPPSVGKSTLALQVIAAAQKAGRPCMFADTEFSFTPAFAESLGVDCSKLELTQFRLGEETFDAVIAWITENQGGVVVLDSIGQILPREEAEKPAEGKTIGLQARLMGAFCRRAVGLLAENDVSLILVNHEVINITTGAVGSSGGAKLAFAKRYSIRLRGKFGAANSKKDDGSTRLKTIEAELKKEKGADTHEGKKIDFYYEKSSGFINEKPDYRKKKEV